MRKREGDTTLVHYCSLVYIDRNIREYLFFQSRTSITWYDYVDSWAVERKKSFDAFSFFRKIRGRRGGGPVLLNSSMKEKMDKVIDDVAIGCDPIWQQRTATSILLKSLSFIFYLVYKKNILTASFHSFNLFRRLNGRVGKIPSISHGTSPLRHGSSVFSHRISPSSL